jgi:hypothetical protein
MKGMNQINNNLPAKVTRRLGRLAAAGGAAGFLLALPLLLLAQGAPVPKAYVPLVGIPGVDPGADFGAYINALYYLSISIAAMLAVIKIIIAGVKWMLTDLVPGKEDAVRDIRGALFGLIIILSAVLILQTINPRLVGTDIFTAAPKLIAPPAAMPKQRIATVEAERTTPTTEVRNGEIITRLSEVSPQSRVVVRHQAVAYCLRRRGFSLGYTVRVTDTETRFVESRTGILTSPILTESIVSIHCFPPPAP